MTSISIRRVLVASLFVVLAGAEFARAERARARILMSDGSRKIGYVGDTNDKGMKFHLTDNPADRGQAFPHSAVRGVSFDEEGDIMQPGRAAYDRERYEEAEQLFRGVAEQYQNLWGIGRDQLGNFACEARFFQIDCLRRLGRYGDIAGAFDTPTGRNLENALPEVHLPALEILELWKHYGRGNWAELESGLQTYQAPLTGGAASLLRAPSFKEDLAPSVIVQLAYLRGQLFRQKENQAAALTDFYRAATIDFGADRILASEALREALKLQTADPAIEESYALQAETHAATRVYAEAYRSGDIELAFRDYLTPPEAPDGSQSEPEAESEPAAPTEEETDGGTEE